MEGDGVRHFRNQARTEARHRSTQGAEAYMERPKQGDLRAKQEDADEALKAELFY